MNTYIVKPRQLVRLGIGSDVALEINVVSFFDVVWIEIWAHLQRDDRHVCGNNTNMSRTLSGDIVIV